jgi:hypothetical protein
MGALTAEAGPDGEPRPILMGAVERILRDLLEPSIEVRPISRSCPAPATPARTYGRVRMREHYLAFRGIDARPPA